MLHWGAVVGHWMPPEPSLIAGHYHFVSMILWWLKTHRLLLSDFTCAWPLTRSQLLVHSICWTAVQNYSVNYTSCWNTLNDDAWDVQTAENMPMAFWLLVPLCHCQWYRYASLTNVAACTAGMSIINKDLKFYAWAGQMFPCLWAMWKDKETNISESEV